jgi:hypothetical protein
VPPYAAAQGCCIVQISTRCPACSSCTAESRRKHWGVKRPRSWALDTRTSSQRYHTCRRGMRGSRAGQVRYMTTTPTPPLVVLRGTHHHSTDKSHRLA